MSIKKRAKVVERFNSPSVNAQPLSPHHQCSNIRIRVDREAIRGLHSSVFLDFFLWWVRLVSDGLAGNLFCEVGSRMVFKLVILTIGLSLRR